MKKKNMPPSLVNAGSDPYVRQRYDSHSAGVGKRPDYSSDPSHADFTVDPSAPSHKRISFPSMVAKGESANEGDVIVHTANGVSSSKGKSKGVQYNWGDGDAGTWNDSDFDNGNLTGM